MDIDGASWRSMANRVENEIIDQYFSENAVSPNHYIMGDLFLNRNIFLFNMFPENLNTLMKQMIKGNSF